MFFPPDEVLLWILHLSEKNIFVCVFSTVKKIFFKEDESGDSLASFIKCYFSGILKDSM